MLERPATEPIVRLKGRTMEKTGAGRREGMKDGKEKEEAEGKENGGGGKGEMT